MVRLVNSMSTDLLLHFLCCEVSSLIRSNAGWNTMMVYQAFCKSMDGSLSRSMALQGRQICVQSVYSSKNKMLPLPQQRWFRVINLPPGKWDDHPGEWRLSGAPCASLLPAVEALVSGHSQAGLGEYKSMLLSPWIATSPATMATSFMGLLGDGGVAGERG